MIGFEIMFFLVFALFICVFVYMFASAIKTWHKNNNSPRLTVPATVVAKRHHRSHNSHTHTSSTHYYATFEFESGDRLELSVPSHEVGLLAEGDVGSLTFQGTRYLGFERHY